MIKLGKYNTMKVEKLVDFGAYLVDSERKEDEPKQEVLLPTRYMPEGLAPEDTIEVFVYKDSEDRPIATTETPFATVGEFAFLEVVQVNDTGAFLDWGLPKDLLVPYSEQKMRMKRGGIYPVYVYLDDATKRIVASARLEHFLGNVIPEYKNGTEVDCLVIQHTEIGYKVIVDNLHYGMVYDNEIFRPLEIGQSVKGYVKHVREDGKIDISLSGKAADRVGELAERIYSFMKINSSNGAAVSEKASPEEIKVRFGCSKKDFKKALGLLYKEHKISISANGEAGIV